MVSYASDATRNSPIDRAKESLCDYDSEGMATACRVQAPGEGGDCAAGVEEGGEREGDGYRYEVVMIR